LVTNERSPPDKTGPMSGRARARQPVGIEESPGSTLLEDGGGGRQLGVEHGGGREQAGGRRPGAGRRAAARSRPAAAAGITAAGDEVRGRPDAARSGLGSTRFAPILTLILLKRSD
jgi:hypothetical protein